MYIYISEVFHDPRLCNGARHEAPAVTTSGSASTCQTHEAFARSRRFTQFCSPLPRRGRSEPEEKGRGRFEEKGRGRRVEEGPDGSEEKLPVLKEARRRRRERERKSRRTGGGEVVESPTITPTRKEIPGPKTPTQTREDAEESGGSEGTEGDPEIGRRALTPCARRRLRGRSQTWSAPAGGGSGS